MVTFNLVVCVYSGHQPCQDHPDGHVQPQPCGHGLLGLLRHTHQTRPLVRGHQHLHPRVGERHGYLERRPDHRSFYCPLPRAQHVRRYRRVDVHDADDGALHAVAAQVEERRTRLPSWWLAEHMEQRDVLLIQNLLGSIYRKNIQRKKKGTQEALPFSCSVMHAVLVFCPTAFNLFNHDG